MKHVLRITLLAILGAAISFGGASGATEVATILVSELNVRSGPGREYRVVMRLPKEAQVRVTQRDKGWLKIDHSGRSGYILNDSRYVRLTTVVAPAETTSAGPAGPEALKALRKKADTLQDRLRASQTHLDSMADQEKTLLQEVNAADQALDRSRRQVRTTQAELDALEAKLVRTQAERETLEKEIETGETYAAERLVALYKLNQVGGKIHLLASADSFFDFISRRTALERILDQDESLLRQLRGQQARLEAVAAQITTDQTKQRTLNTELKQRIAQLDSERTKRGELLAQVRGARELEEAALKSLAHAAQELDTAMRNLWTEPDAEVERPVAAPRAPGEGFEQHKGLLNWPVKGKIISFFGPSRDARTNLVTFQSGINIRAERGEPIRAVSDGYAIYSSWFKGFGNMMIIDHGDHYYTVYAHLEEVFKVRGDRVEKGEVIATVGDTGSLMGPALHFQVRHHGTPIDPLEWINRG